MSELKIGEVGRINGQVVKCVLFEYFNGCEQCVFFDLPTCKDIPCERCGREDGQSVKFITPTFDEIKEFEDKEYKK